MLQTERLPKITFVGSNSEQTLDLSNCAGQIGDASKIVAQMARESSPVGLIFRTGPELVLAWLGVLAAGRVPLILQYPTEKMSKAYWLDSIRDTTSKCGVAALLCSSELAVHALDEFARCAFIEHFAVSDTSAPLTFPAAGDILQ